MMNLAGGWNAVKLAIGVWLAFLLGLAIYSYFHPTSHTVYTVYSSAAHKWWAGRDMYVFDQEFYRYSPLFAILVSPIAFLPPGWDVALWKLLNCLCYAAGLGLWARRVLPATLSRNEIAAIFLLVLPVSLNSMYIGQANVVMLGTILLGLAFVRDQAWNRAAICLALATLIKGYPLALAMILGVQFPRRFMGRFTLALAMGLLLPFAAQAPQTVVAQYASWIAHLQDSASIMRERLRSFDHLVGICGYPISPTGYAFLGMVSGGGVLLLCIRKRRRCANDCEYLTYTYQFFSVWVLLFGPATESCTYVVAGPAIAWALVDVYRRGAVWWAMTWLGVSLMLMEPLRTDLFGPVVRNFANEHGSQPIGGLLFLGFLLLPPRLYSRPRDVVARPQLEDCRSAA